MFWSFNLFLRHDIIVSHLQFVACLFSSEVELNVLRDILARDLETMEADEDDDSIDPIGSRFSMMNYF